MDKQKQVLIRRITTLIQYRVLLLTPEFWEIPILKWALEIECKLMGVSQLNLSQVEYKEMVKSAFFQGLVAWQRENADRDLTNEERFWWYWYGNVLRVIPDGEGIKLMVDTINNDHPLFESNVKAMQEQGLIPNNLSPLEFAALVLAPPKVNIDGSRIPPKHNFWWSLGVENAGQWDVKSNTAQLVAFIRHIRSHSKAYLGFLVNRSGLSDKMKHRSDVQGVEYSSEDDVGYMSDPDRLSQFYELAGVDIAHLTYGDGCRMLDLLNALDIGHSFASKTGFSINAYYGDRADSEKTQRQRLFRKIRRITKRKHE